MTARAAFCAALLFCASARGADEAGLKATQVEGAVTAGGRALHAGDAVHEGEVLETAPASRVEVRFPDGSLLRLGEATRFQITTSAPAARRFSAKLFAGNVWARVQKLLARNEQFQIETENAVAGVRGTEFRVEAASGREDLVRVYEGVVEVRDERAGWTHRVEHGSELAFRRDRSPEGPRKFDAAADKRDGFMGWVRSRRERETDRPERRKHERRK